MGQRDQHASRRRDRGSAAPGARRPWQPMELRDVGRLGELVGLPGGGKITGGFDAEGRKGQGSG